MRDLSARLREIVKRERAATKTDAGHGFSVEAGENPGPASVSAAAVAEALGGVLHTVGGSSCVAIDRVWAEDHWHGRGRVGAFQPPAGGPIELFDHRLTEMPGWARRPVFFDVETTGLSGGAGTLAFLVACGWFDGDGGFRVRQFFLAGPAGEHAMLHAVADILGEASMLVSFNGRTFDVPLMEMRWAFHRQPCPTDDLPHFDMLSPARRLWSLREESENAASCSLQSLERAVLRFSRLHDVPGLEIPARYFHFLRTGDARAIAGVLEHNQHDLLSLAALFAHALGLAQEGPDAARDSGEQLGLGRIYERAGDTNRAARAYELAAGTMSPPHVRMYALSRLAMLLRRDARHDEAAAAWQGVIDLGADPGGRRGLSPIERQAAEALAIHHEHRARDLAAARRYAMALRGQATGRAVASLDHRLGRIARKLERRNAAGAFGWDRGE